MFFDTKEMCRPISETNFVTFGPHRSRVSAPAGTKERPGLNDNYFLFFFFSAFVLVLPGLEADVLT